MDAALVTRRTRAFAAAGGGVLVLATGAWLSVTPSHERNWLADQRLLPTAVFDGSEVTIRNVREFRYDARGTIDERFAERGYDLAQLESVWYVLVPFSNDWRGPAHSFLSFGFADGRHLSISVEARRRQGQIYSMIGGMLKRYELMYAVADEQDMITLRAVQRGDDVYVYPIRTEPGQARALLVSMLERVNGIAERPEFYHTLTNNCTTNILDHVNEVAERRIAYSWRVLLPGYSDEVAFRRGLIDTDLDLAGARSRFNVTERAVRWADDPDFSLRIRDFDG